MTSICAKSCKKQRHHVLLISSNHCCSGSTVGAAAAELGNSSISRGSVEWSGAGLCSSSCSKHQLQGIQAVTSEVNQARITAASKGGPSALSDGCCTTSCVADRSASISRLSPPLSSLGLAVVAAAKVSLVSMGDAHRPK